MAPAISDFLIGPLKFASQSPSTVRFLGLRKGVFELSLSHLSGICFLCLRGVFYTANFFSTVCSRLVHIQLVRPASVVAALTIDLAFILHVSMPLQPV